MLLHIAHSIVVSYCNMQYLHKVNVNIRASPLKYNGQCRTCARKSFLYTVAEILCETLTHRTTYNNHCKFLVYQSILVCACCCVSSMFDSKKVASPELMFTLPPEPDVIYLS